MRTKGALTKQRGKGIINMQESPYCGIKMWEADIVKYLVAILIVLLVLIFFPQILGVVLGSALAIAVFPQLKILLGVIVIWAILALLLRNDKRYTNRNEKKRMTANKIKE
ncbi:hypothetical protein [Paenibacillus sp. GCM10012303]|uniref:hypothetical protein n=1 Tax=Paenibacillus sp. GCM10012303 TaxID=3317340 RepID=UPI00360713AF